MKSHINATCVHSVVVYHLTYEITIDCAIDQFFACYFQVCIINSGCFTFVVKETYSKKWFYFAFVTDNYTCIRCSYDLSRIALLDHCRICPYINRPNDDYKFVCFACDFHTHKNQNMLLHIRKHTGERPYACIYCVYKSKYPSDLKRHVNIKHNKSDVLPASSFNTF